MKNAGNFIFLGIAISYLIIAFIQLGLDFKLPAYLYMTISFLSLELSLMELLKVLIRSFINSLKKYVNIKKKRIDFNNRHIQILKNLDFIKDLNKPYMHITSMDDEETIKNKKLIVKLEKKENLLVIFQIVVCTVQIILTPLKNIPYNEHTEKVINIATILTFAIMFFTYYFSNNINDANAYEDELLKVEEHYISYYLDILEKIDKAHNNKA